MKIAWLDFEYHDHADKDLELICASMYAQDEDGYKQWFFYDLRTEVSKNSLRRDLATYDLIGCYSSMAEGQGLMALGIDPLSKEWIDVYTMFTMLVNGEYNVTTDDYGIETTSKLSKGLTAACEYLKVPYEAQKEETLAILLSGDTWTDAQWDTIKEYSYEDVKVLPELYDIILPKLMYRYNRKDEAMELKFIKYHSKYGARMGVVSRVGFPMDMVSLRNVANNKQRMIKDYMHEFNAEVYPIFVRGVKKYENQVLMMKHYGLYDGWPTTTAGRLAFDEDTIKLYTHASLEQYLSTSRKISTLKWFTEGGEVFDRIDDKGILRSNVIPSGTVTGRNSQRTKQYPLTMSSWVRALIRPPKGWSIVSADYNQQEVLIAALISGDNNLLESYRSGDVYLHFAKLAGAVPWEGTKEEYSVERNLFKSTVLGLQFGMGKSKLALKLTVDTGITTSEKEAQKLANKHRKAYQTYYKWKSDVTDVVRQGGVLQLADGWSLDTTCARLMTCLNFPIQGTGAAVLKLAVQYAQDAGLRIMTTLHDAIYLIEREDVAEKRKDILLDCMRRAFKKALKTEEQIRISSKIYNHEDIWVEEKAQKDFDTFKHILFKERLGL